MCQILRIKLYFKKGRKEEILWREKLINRRWDNKKGRERERERADDKWGGTKSVESSRTTKKNKIKNKML